MLRAWLVRCAWVFCTTGIFRSTGVFGSTRIGRFFMFGGTGIRFAVFAFGRTGIFPGAGVGTGHLARTSCTGIGCTAGGGQGCTAHGGSQCTGRQDGLCDCIEFHGALLEGKARPKWRMQVLVEACADSLQTQDQLACWREPQLSFICSWCIGIEISSRRNRGISIGNKKSACVERRLYLELKRTFE